MPNDSASFSSLHARGSRRRRPGAGAAAAGAAIGALLWSAPAPAFFQQTSLEGPVGTDIGGVWLSVQQILPEFRIQFSRPAQGPILPFKVAPIPASLEPVLGKHPKGVSISECTDAAKCADYGIFVGDVLVKVNSAEVNDVAAFDRALTTPAPNILLSIRRPAMKMTTARLIKIKYAASQGSGEGVSAVGGETVDIQALDLRLPFADKLEETRRTHELWQAAAADLKALETAWPTLPLNNPLYFLKGKHRLVAASDYDEALSADQSLKGTKSALVMDLEGAPQKGSAGGKNIDVYGFESVTSKRMEGAYVTVAMASAPFPINVEFKGRFVMTRIADWSDQDVKALEAAEAAKKPKEDLGAYKLAPDVPPSTKAATPPVP